MYWSKEDREFIQKYKRAIIGWTLPALVAALVYIFVLLSAEDATGKGNGPGTLGLAILLEYLKILLIGYYIMLGIYSLIKLLSTLNNSKTK